MYMCSLGYQKAHFRLGKRLAEFSINVKHWNRFLAHNFLRKNIPLITKQRHNVKENLIEENGKNQSELSKEGI